MARVASVLSLARGQAKRNKRDALLMPLAVRAISEMSAKRRIPPVDMVTPRPVPRSLVWLIAYSTSAGIQRSADEFVSRGERIFAKIVWSRRPAWFTTRQFFLLFSSWLISLVEYLVNLIKNLATTTSKKNRRLHRAARRWWYCPAFLFPWRRRHASFLTTSPPFLSFARPNLDEKIERTCNSRGSKGFLPSFVGI